MYSICYMLHGVDKLPHSPARVNAYNMLRVVGVAWVGKTGKASTESCVRLCTNHIIY